MPDRPAPAQDAVAEHDLTAAEVKSKAASGVALILGRGLLFRVLGLLGTLVLTRLLAPQDFGLVAVGLTLVHLGQFLADAGLGAALIARAKPPKHGELRAMVGLQLVITTAVALAAGGIAASVGEDGLVTAFMMLALPLAAFRSPAMLMLQRQLAFKKVVRVEITEILVYVVWAISTAALGLGAWSLATATVGKTLVGTLAACSLSPAGFLLPSLGFSRLRSILRFGARFQATGFIQVGHDASLNGGIAAIAGIPALGLWSFASRILQVPYLLFEAMWGVGFPAFSRLLAAGEEGGVRNLLERMVGTMAVSVAAVMSPLVACSPALVPVLFGDAWTDVSLILSGSALGLTLYGPVGICAYGYLYAAGDATTPLQGAILASSVRLAVTFALLPAVGVAAIGIGWAAASLSEMPLVLRRVHARNGARLGREVVRPALSGVVAGAVGWAVAAELGETLASGVASAAAAFGIFGALMAVLARGDLAQALVMLRRAFNLARTGMRTA